MEQASNLTESIEKYNLYHQWQDVNLIQDLVFLIQENKYEEIDDMLQ